MDLPCGISIANLQQVDLVERSSFHFVRFLEFCATHIAAQSALSTCISQIQKNVAGCKSTSKLVYLLSNAKSSSASCASSIAPKHLNLSCRQSLLDRSASHLKVANPLFHLPMPLSLQLQSAVSMKSVSVCHTVVASICSQISPANQSARSSKSSKATMPKTKYTVPEM